MAYKQSPFPMIDGTKGHNKYKERQLKKAARLTAKAEKREARTAETTATFTEAGPKWEGVEPLWGTGKYARKRAERAKAKAQAGSRKAYRKGKRAGIYKTGGFIEPPIEEI